MAPYTQLYAHCVWSTFGRLPLILPEVEDRLYAVIATKSKEMSCRVLAIGGVEDHVHLLVNFPPVLALSRLVKDVKGASSHFMNHQVGSTNIFRWQGGYGVFTVSQRSVETVVDYIRHQKMRHANRQLIDELERIDAD